MLSYCLKISHEACRRNEDIQGEGNAQLLTLAQLRWRILKCFGYLCISKRKAMALERLLKYHGKERRQPKYQ